MGMLMKEPFLLNLITENAFFTLKIWKQLWMTYLDKRVTIMGLLWYIATKLPYIRSRYISNAMLYQRNNDAVYVKKLLIILMNRLKLIKVCMLYNVEREKDISQQSLKLYLMGTYSCLLHGWLLAFTQHINHNWWVLHNMIEINSGHA
jgi:hypothetical protein